MGYSVIRGRSDEETADLACELRARSIAYEILHTFLYREPQPELLIICAEHDLFGSFPYADANDDIARGLGLIRGYLAVADPLGNEDDLADLSWDFTELFVGPKAPTAPPWASFYLEPQQLLFQHTTLYARQLYRKYGLMAGSRLNEEADDHVALELEFLGRLAERSASLVEEGECDLAGFQELIDDQVEFVSGHVLRYMCKFVEVVERNARLGFYKGLTLVALGFLKEDLEYLRGLSETLRMESEEMRKGERSGE